MIPPKILLSHFMKQLKEESGTQSTALFFCHWGVYRGGLTLDPPRTVAAD